MGHMASSVFFLSKKEQVVASTLKVCALIDLHCLAADYEMGSSGSQSPDLGDMWKYGCPKSPIWSSPCSASVTSGDDEEYGHNNECRAIEVVGKVWSSEVVALFLEDWEGARLSCRMAMDFLCQEMRDACWVGSESLGSLLSHFSEQDGKVF